MPTSILTVNKPEELVELTLIVI